MSGALLIVGFTLSFFERMTNVSIWFYLASILTGGLFVVISTFRGLIKQRFLNISFLVTVAAIGAIYIGQYGEAAAVVFLFSLAEFFESYGVEKSHKTVAALLKRSPKVARLKNGKTVPVEEVRIGDVVLVRPGEQIPLDGVILEGYSSIDESTITEESTPVNKHEGGHTVCGNNEYSGVS